MARPQTEGGSVSWGPRGPRGPAGEGRGQKPSPLAAARAGPACRRGLPGSPSHAWLWLVLWMRDLDLGKGLGLSCCRCCPRCPNRPPAGSGRRCPATGAQGQLLCCSARAPGRWAMPGPAGCCNPGLFSSPRPGPTAGACCQGCRHSVPSFLPSSWLLGPGGEGGHEWVNWPQSHLLRHLHFLNRTTPSPLWVFIHVIPSTCNAPFPLRHLVNSYSSFNTPPRHQLL